MARTSFVPSFRATKSLKCEKNDLKWDEKKRVLSLKANDELQSKIAEDRKDSMEKTPQEETWKELQAFFGQNIKQFEQLETVMRQSHKKK